MAHYYKHDIPRWQKGTASLSDRAYRVYHVIIEQIMIAEAPILYHDKTLAGLSNRSTRDLRAAVAELVDARKIEIFDGMIHNDRCGREIEGLNATRKNISDGRRSALARKPFEDHSPEKIIPIVGEQCANGARMVSETHEKPNENNDAERVEVAIDKTRQDKSKKGKNKQKADPDLTGMGEAGAPPEKSVKEILQGVLDAGMSSALIAHRKAKRAPLTPYSAELLVKQFSEYGDPQWAVETILTQGWQGFRADWMKNFPKPAAIAGATDATDWRPILDLFCKIRTWQWGRLSPEPGSPGCKIPADIIAEYAGKLPENPLAAANSGPRLSLVPSHSERAA